MKYKFTINRDIERAIAIFRSHNERYEKNKIDNSEVMPTWCGATYDEWAELYESATIL